MYTHTIFQIGKIFNLEISGGGNAPLNLSEGCEGPVAPSVSAPAFFKQQGMPELFRCSKQYLDVEIVL